MHRVLFDTNILLDISVPGRPQKAEARRAIELCNGYGNLGIVSSLSLKDAYYLLCRRYDEPTARKWVEGFMGLLAIAPIGPEECIDALKSNESDFEDGLIRATAETNDVDFIITRDKNAFAKSKVRSVTAAEYLEIVA